MGSSGYQPRRRSKLQHIPTLEMFLADDPPCYDRSAQSQTAVVDTHLHFRPFGGPAIPFEEMVSYLEATGVLFANVYGIGQTLPVTSSCTYYVDCPGTPVTPTLKNDFVNAANHILNAPAGVHLTLSMSFPDLSRPETILPRMQLLDEEYPGAFAWMGEVNLVKQALFGNGRAPVPPTTLPKWAPFMEALRDRSIPLAIHADLGHDEEPTRYLPLMEDVLRLYPDNTIVWVHMGLSRELVEIDAARHVRIVKSLLDRYPKLLVDIAWRVLDDVYFLDPATLADGLQGLEAVAALGRMQTDALGRAVIDGHEHAGRPLAHGHRGRHVGAPHHVRRLGGDRAVVRRRAMRLAPAVRGLEVVRTH